MRAILVIAAAALVCGSTARAATVAPQARGPIVTGLGIGTTLVGDAGRATLARIAQTGATTVHIGLTWSAVAPANPASGFDASNPADPQYDWASFDDQLSLVAASGLDPVVAVYGAPTWAEGKGDPGKFPVKGTVRPDAQAYGQFMLAAARRYSGSFQNLPRVRYWQIWNEPNIHLDLNPQLDARGRPVSPSLYRSLVNAAAASLHAVHADNVVIAGGTAPFRDDGYPGDWGPLTFMRDLLCLSRTLHRTCHQRVHFDVWAHNPYTSGDPQHHAILPDDVSLGDLGKMRNVLLAAAKAGVVVSNRPVGFWLTEFSWDSNPPDPKGVPMALEARWISEMLYRVWLVGVQRVYWLALSDFPLSENFVQAGLYFTGSTPAGGAPKPLLEAFRFPVVAFRTSNGVAVWGRTPTGAPATVVVEKLYRGHWSTLARISANRYGIFQKRYKTSPYGYVRARIAGTGEASLKFSLRAVPDHFYNPFGTSLTG